MREQDREVYKKKYPMHNLTLLAASVRLYIEGNQEYFSFGDYGGIDGAIKAAKIKRDSYPANMIHSNYDPGRSGPTGNSDTPGVTPYYSRYNGEWLGYLARWSVGPVGYGRRRQATKTFRFDRYDDPLQEAIDYRDKMNIKNSMSELG